MSKTISGLPIAETLTGDELLPVVQDGNTVQATVEQVVALVGNTATWGDIQGTLSDQTDLQTALDNKYSTSNPAGYITASALTGYAPLNSPTFTGTVGGITKSMVGLGNVDNTADANKSVNYANTAGSASNSDTVDGYNIQVDGTGTNPNTIYFKTEGGVDPSQAIWGDITGSIVDQTDLYNALVNGTYATGNWNINAESVDGYNIQVDGTGTNPNTIYFKTEGGTISVDWDDVTNTPTTIAGYGITDAYTETESDARFLGISATAVNSDMVDGYNIQVDGTGTNPNTIYFKTEGGTTSVEWGNISGTLSDQTDLQTALNGKVPYTGATGNVNLGEYGLTSGFLQADLTPTNALQVGRMQWNDADGTMDLRLKGNNVTLQIGQEQVIRVVNKTGADLLEANYQCVKISGAQGQRPKVALAQANNDANSADTIGLVTETIANNQEGFVTDSGMVTNINTTGSLQGETWADGDVLYLSGTVAGRLTNIKPQAPIHTVIVGFVIYAHNNQGKIYVKVDNGYELNELHNVRINGVTDGQVLAYDSTLSVWENINQSAITSGNSDKVDGYNVQVDGTGTDPNTIYFKTEGGSISVDWDDISNTPTTVAGYGITDAVTTSGNQTIGGTKTFSSTITGSITGNAGTVTNGVYTTGDQTIGGTKTFSSTISGSVSGNAGTVTNGVYTTGNQTIGGTKSFSTSPIYSDTGFQYHQHTSAHVAYIKKTGAYNWYWRRNDTGLIGGANEANLMELFDSGSLSAYGDMRAPVFYDSNNTAYYLDPANTGTSMVVAGNVGIGTTSPASKLDVVTGATGQIFTFRGAGTAFGFASGVLAGANALELTTAGTSGVQATRMIFRGNTDSADIEFYRGARGSETISMHIEGDNGNVGVGGTPDYRLDVFGGALRVNGNAKGVAGDASIFFGSTTNNYIYAGNANNIMAFGTNGAERIRLDNAGNVGIGTSSPVSKLEVKGAGFVASSISGDSTSETQLRFLTNTGARISQQANQALIFDTNATERMRITDAGNVGIGTTSPTFARLVVFSPANSPSLVLTDNTQSTLTVKHETGNLLTYEVNGTATQRWVGNGSERMRIDGGGKVLVGAGATASLGKLVVSESSSGTAVIALESQGSWNSQISATSTGNMIFSNGGTERMRIASNGSVGIARVPDISFALDVGGEVRIINAISGNYGGAFRLYNTSSGATNPAKHFRISPTGTLELINSAYNAIAFSFTDSGYFYATEEIHAKIFRDTDNSAYYLDPNNTATSLNVAGSIVAAGNVTAYSDIRVKDNVENITDAIDKLNQIRGVTYTRTDLDDKERRFAGVIAQEIEQVLPEAVFDNGKVKGVDYNATIALLIEAVKEQQKRIDKLETLLNKGN